MAARAGEKRIRRNSLTTLHSLPTTQSDIPPPSLGLVRQTTVPHGFNVGHDLEGQPHLILKGCQVLCVFTGARFVHVLRGAVAEGTRATPLDRKGNRNQGI